MRIIFNFQKLFGLNTCCLKVTGKVDDLMNWRVSRGCNEGQLALSLPDLKD